jgi:hypothetical protein
MQLQYNQSRIIYEYLNIYLMFRENKKMTYIVCYSISVVLVLEIMYVIVYNTK